MNEQSVLELLKTIIFLLAILAIVVSGSMAIILHLKGWMNRVEARDDRRTAEMIHDQNQKDHIALLQLQREFANERQEFLKERLHALSEKEQS